MNAWTNNCVLQCWCLVVVRFQCVAPGCLVHRLGCASLSTQKPLSIAVCLLAEPKLPDFEANFRQLLLKSCYNHPNEAIISTIVRRLTARMIACNNANQAADLYEDASFLPGASTAKHLMTQHNLNVNGPLYPRCEGRQNKFQHLFAWTCKMLTDLHWTIGLHAQG